MANMLQSAGEEKKGDNFAARENEPASKNELSQQPKVDISAMIKEINLSQEVSVVHEMPKKRVKRSANQENHDPNVSHYQHHLTENWPQDDESIQMEKTSKPIQYHVPATPTVKADLETRRPLHANQSTSFFSQARPPTQPATKKRKKFKGKSIAANIPVQDFETDVAEFFTQGLSQVRMVDKSFNKEPIVPVTT